MIVNIINLNNSYFGYFLSFLYSIGNQQSVNNKHQMQVEQQSIRNKLRQSKIPLWIFICNLPWEWRRPQLQGFLHGYDKILEIIFMAKKNMKSKIAYVQFDSMKIAQTAIQQKQGSIVLGSEKPIFMKWLESQEGRLGIGEKDGHKLFIGSLPRQAREQDIYSIFSLIGQVESIRLEPTQYWAFVEYRHKQSAILAIRHLNGQVYLHGSHIPIDVRFKQRKYNSFMTRKHQIESINPFQFIQQNIYSECIIKNSKFYLHFKSGQFIEQMPPAGSKIRGLDGKWNTIRPTKNFINDSNYHQRKSGPAGSNLFLFHLPSDIPESQIYKLFCKFGPIISVRIMTEKNGKSKGVGFVSFVSASSAQAAIDEMNGYELKGKRLKVELNKKDENVLGGHQKFQKFDFSYN